MMNKVRFVTLVLLIAFAMSLSASTITFTGTSTTNTPNLSATAVFDVTGSTLKITLTNNNPAKDPASVLIALFFDLDGNPVLTYQSAVTAAGTCLVGLNASCSPYDAKASGEWLYASGNPLNGLTQNYGLGTAGLGVFSSSGGPQFNYGLINGVTGDANPQLASAAANGNTFIDDTLIITLSGLPSGFDAQTDISNVRFQYGTSLTEPFTPGIPEQPQVPEPASLMLMGSGLSFAAMRLRKRK